MNADYFVLLFIVYGANIVVAGFVGGASLFAPTFAAEQLMDGTVEANDSIRLLGTLWLALALLSILGIFEPLRMTPVLCVQLLYKGLWLLFVALPLLLKGNTADLPRVMFVVFIIYLIVLPFAIPFSHIFGLT